MPGALIIAIIGGGVVVWYLLNKMVDKGMDAADRAIRHKTYERGRAEASAELLITVPVPPADAIDAIVKTVNAYEKAPPLVAGLYLRDRSGTEAVFGFGSKLQDAFVAAVTFDATPTGASGHFEVLAWQESGADVHGRDEMTRLRGRVTEAVRGPGGTTEQV